MVLHDECKSRIAARWNNGALNALQYSRNLVARDKSPPQFFINHHPDILKGGATNFGATARVGGARLTQDFVCVRVRAVCSHTCALGSLAPSQ